MWTCARQRFAGSNSSNLDSYSPCVVLPSLLLFNVLWKREWTVKKLILLSGRILLREVLCRRRRWLLLACFSQRIAVDINVSQINNNDCRLHTHTPHPRDERSLRGKRSHVAIREGRRLTVRKGRENESRLNIVVIFIMNGSSLRLIGCTLSLRRYVPQPRILTPVWKHYEEIFTVTFTCHLHSSGIRKRRIG